jgi:hypothetical protein
MYRIEKDNARQIGTAVAFVTMSRGDNCRAHDACQADAGLWNRAVNWVPAEWNSGNSPLKYDILHFLTALPVEIRPLHVYATTEIIAHDLSGAITISRANRNNAIKVRSPWCKKNYRPLSFSKGYGWVMEAMACKRSRADGLEAPFVRSGRLTS